MVHTPGPWMWEGSTLINSDDFIILWPTKDINGVAYIGVNADDCELITAAPDLLAACEALVSHISKIIDFGERPCPLCNHHHIHDKGCPYLGAKTAIAAAKGE